MHAHEAGSGHPGPGRPTAGSALRAILLAPTSVVDQLREDAEQLEPADEAQRFAALAAHLARQGLDLLDAEPKRQWAARGLFDDAPTPFAWIRAEGVQSG